MHPKQAVFVLALAALVGCGGPTAPPAASNTTAAPAATAAADAPTAAAADAPTAAVADAPTAAAADAPTAAAPADAPTAAAPADAPTADAPAADAPTADAPAADGESAGQVIIQVQVPTTADKPPVLTPFQGGDYFNVAMSTNESIVLVPSQGLKWVKSEPRDDSATPGVINYWLYGTVVSGRFVLQAQVPTTVDKPPVLGTFQDRTYVTITTANGGAVQVLSPQGFTWNSVEVNPDSATPGIINYLLNAQPVAAVSTGDTSTVAPATPAAPADAPTAEAPAAATAEAPASAQPTALATTAQCAPGWVICVTLADPKITIMGSRAVSQSAVDAAAHIYSDMTSRFTAAYPKNKFDGYTIYMTNGEPWSELQNLAPIGTMWKGTVENGMAQGDELRGGTSPDYLWIDEQMMCKRGIKTRNDAFAAGKRRQRDDTVRTFDQVIHEFGHAIDFRFGLEKRVAQVYGANPKPVERFPQSIQSIFGAPTIPLGDGERTFLNEIFSSSTTYSCDMYTLAEVNTVKLEVGKQYAFREANNTFRYFQLTSIPNAEGAGSLRIDLCPRPGKMGSITMGDATDLTTVESALQEKLTPKGEPCGTDIAPHGVFINGASLPRTP